MGIATDDKSCDPSDLLEASIIKLFKEAFDLDLKTCTKEQWAQTITINGGELKQWQSLIKFISEGEGPHE